MKRAIPLLAAVMLFVLAACSPKPIPAPTSTLTATPPSAPAQYGAVTIRYDANGGSGAPASQSVTKDSGGIAKYNLSTAIPVKDGYKFTGWQLEDDTAHDYHPGQYIANDTGSAAGDITLTYYARWDTADPPTPPVSNVAIQYNGKDMSDFTMAIGSTVQLRVIFFPIDAGVTPVWSIADTSVATVDQTGLVTGVSPGATKATVTIDGVSADCIVRVKGG